MFLNRSNLYYDYLRNINLNISCFGDEYQMYIIDNILKMNNEYHLISPKNFPIKTISGSYSCKYAGNVINRYWADYLKISKKIKWYNSQNISIEFDFSNINLRSGNFDDKELQIYLNLLNGENNENESENIIKNGIICTDDNLAKKIKNEFPNLNVIASSAKFDLNLTKEMGEEESIEYCNSILEIYDKVIIKVKKIESILIRNQLYQSRDIISFLNKLNNKEKIELIINDYDNIANEYNRSENHENIVNYYNIISAIQSRICELDNNIYKIKNDHKIFTYLYDLRSLSNKDEINELIHNNDFSINRDYINMIKINTNILNFKLESRTSSNKDFIFLLYIYLFNIESNFHKIYEKFINDNFKIKEYNPKEFENHHIVF